MKNEDQSSKRPSAAPFKFQAAQAVGVSSAIRLAGKSTKPGSTEPR